MAVIEYLEGDHPAGFVGVRAVTTVGSHTDYRQAYFSYSEYGPTQARALAELVNERWRQQADDQRRQNWLRPSHTRSGPGHLASGLRADLLSDKKFRGGETRTYYYPAFIVDRSPVVAGSRTLSFPINVPAGRTLASAYQRAVREYVDQRQFGEREHAELVSRMPPPGLFVTMAIRLGMRDRVIDINAVRRRVGLPEL